MAYTNIDLGFKNKQCQRWLVFSLWNTAWILQLKTETWAKSTEQKLKLLCCSAEVGGGRRPQDELVPSCLASLSTGTGYLHTAVEEAGSVLLGSTASALPVAVPCPGIHVCCVISMLPAEGYGSNVMGLGRRCPSWLLCPAVPWGSGGASYWLNNQTWSNSFMLGFNMGCSY